MTAKIFHDSVKLSSFSSMAKRKAAVKQAKGKSSARETPASLERQDAYTLHKSERKRFPRNPHRVTNDMKVWESDLLDVENISKYNNNFKYLLTVIDVFTKILHVVVLKSKT